MSLIRQTTATVGKLLLRTLKTPHIRESRGFKRWLAPTLHELHKRRQKVGPEPAKPRSTYLEWNYDAEIFAFGKRLGEDFNRDVLKQALTHRSYANQEQASAREKGIEDFQEIHSNQELIKEGSQIVSRHVIDELSKEHPDDAVRALHDYLTTEKMLAHVARHMGLTDIVLTAEFPVEDSTLSDSFKAIVAALKASQGLDRAELLVKDFLLCQLVDKEVFDVWNPENPLEYLRDLLRKRGIEDIEPRLCNHSATNTILANYQVGLYNNRKLLGIGWGESIDVAKDTAALNAIQRIHYGR